LRKTLHMLIDSCSYDIKIYIIKNKKLKFLKFQNPVKVIKL